MIIYHGKYHADAEVYISSKLSHLKPDATVMCLHISKGALTDSMMLEIRTSIRRQKDKSMLTL